MIEMLKSLTMQKVFAIALLAEACTGGTSHGGTECSRLKGSTFRLCNTDGWRPDPMVSSRQATVNCCSRRELLLCPRVLYKPARMKAERYCRLRIHR
jgi:hypothetical protein